MAKQTSDSKTLATWLMSATPTEWTLAMVAVASCVIAYLQYSEAVEQNRLSAENLEASIQARNDAATSAVDAETEQSEVQQLEPSASDPAGNGRDPANVEEGLGFIVQLASYLNRNCSVAQEEVDLYADLFGTAPSLFLSPSSRYVVVGVMTRDEAQANQVVQTARSSADDARYSMNDLGSASVRENPDWRPLVSCSEIEIE